MATVHVLGNPAAGAGRGHRAVEQTLAAVRARGHDVEELRAADGAAARACVERAVADGATRLVVVGGDGLAHLATQVVAGTDVVLGMVPVGTGNDFARGLGLVDGHGDIDAAVARALADAAPVDALHTNHGWVASVATLGFSAAVNARANRLRRPRGGLRYTVATLLELPRLRPLPLHIELDGVHHDVDVSLLAVANTAYFGGGMAICPDADPTDGRLELALVGAVGRATLLRFFPQVFRGRHVTHPAVTMLSGRHLRIDHAPPETADAGLWGDGEPVGPLPVDIEVVPAALHIAGLRVPDSSDIVRGETP
jgi:diacylglycerol kinase (ATP)